MDYDAYYAARDQIFEFIRKDAFGPIQSDELLKEPPLDTYVCGILWPRNSQTVEMERSSEVEVENPTQQLPDSNFGSELEEEQPDVIREANRFRPSVMALSFALPASARSIEFSFSAARYENIDKPVEGKDYVLHEFQRHPLSTGRIELSLPERKRSVSLQEGRSRLQIVRRRAIASNANLWTVSVENLARASKNLIDQNTASLFQCQLNLFADFAPIESAGAVTGDMQRRRQEFLYRNVRSYAAGHGCSVQWEVRDNRVAQISSTFLPMVTVPQMLAVSEKRFSCFRMGSWIDSRRSDGLEELSDYVRAYSDWADGLREQLSSLSASFQEVGKELLAKIADCIERLLEGIRVLRTNDVAWRAFLLMNRAMMRQSAKKRGQSEDEVSWYSFQLCYVLMCIPEIVDPASRWREVVDLLWFPTGGGKTEAYLGVAAFVIFHRRLTKGEAGRGVTALMRYTLRMLTAQQFERAAALICECELIRREEDLPGGEISIGLWVGGEVTPNHVTSEQGDVETAETALQKLKLDPHANVQCSPIQLKSCPYCGTALPPASAFEIRRGQFRAHCPNEHCAFHADLPVVTVDDDIYARRPTLLIGTIDKFARLAWEERTGAIFAEDGECLPPELLIQDELHLISGPLGSIGGLYEIAVERLMSNSGVPPKVLASTATLCNADMQIRALYGREAFQFPPSGFDANDSFFAKIATAQERPLRAYVGYCETGGSLADAIVRVFGAARFAAEYLVRSGTNPAVVDQFWTNVGYFNSLKDLGSADTLLMDRACAYANSLRLHKIRTEAEQVQMPQIPYTFEHGELTSRRSIQEITEIRNRLDTYHYPDPATLNYVLSSNMLSVGIDINRLGMMTVYAQPKSTSEYIQATSRVGRSNPGLVVVLLNMLRTRDKSHFEQFETYHQALNRMVEPTSVTPYACRAMDKALHSVFVILVRHLCPDLRENKRAADFRGNDPRVRALRDFLLAEIARRSSETAAYAREILDNFIELWHETTVCRGAHLRYQLFGDSENDTDALLIPAERGEGAVFPTTMNSMRNVDTQSGVYLKVRRKL